MTLTTLNEAPEDIARAALLQCCGSERWADELITLRPFLDAKELHAAGEGIWSSMAATEWLAAFSKHPRIGERKPLSEWSAEEQRGMESAGESVSELLAQKNEAYWQKFGWIFIVCASGRTGTEMLWLLEQRLPNSPADELTIAVGEQAKIMHLRLEKLLAA